MNKSELNTVKEMLNGELKKDFSISQTNSTNVLTVSNLKDAKTALIILDMLTYTAVLHNPTKNIIEVIFN